MWLSRQIKPAPPTADADLGMTTIAGDSVGVVTRGEVRALPVYGPGGYVWMPANGSVVLVIDKTRNASYSVKNQDMIARGGQCRRVVYTPGQSTWAAMRYTGEYQIQRSREEELAIEVELAGSFLAFPGDVVRLRLEALGIDWEYRVAETENELSPNRGETITLTLRERI